MNQEERRRSLRVPCENFVRYSLINEDGKEIKNHFGLVHCKNISLVGVLFTTFEPISLGATVKLELQMDTVENSFEDVTLYATVVRCQRIRSTDTYDIAASITTMLEAGKRLKFINWLANKDDESHFQ